MNGGFGWGWFLGFILAWSFSDKFEEFHAWLACKGWAGWKK